MSSFLKRTDKDSRAFLIFKAKKSLFNRNQKKGEIIKNTQNNQINQNKSKQRSRGRASA